MKKVVSLFMVLCLIIASLISVYAVDTTTIYYNKVTGDIGDNVKISVGIKNNVGITGLLLKVEYDPSTVEINDISNGSAFSNAIFTTPDMSSAIASPFVISWVSLDGLDTNGTILNIDATLKKNMANEFPINIISYEANDIEEKDVNIILDNGAVPTIYFESKQCRPGETVEVPIIVENNPGISGLGIEIEYDNTLLTLNGIENNNLLSGAYFEHGDISKRTVTLNWASINESTRDGVVAKCSFTVNSQAELGTVPLNVTVIESIDVNEIEVPLYGKASALKISTTASTSTPVVTTPPSVSPTPVVTTPISSSEPIETTEPTDEPIPTTAPTPCFTVDNQGTYADIINTGEEQKVAVIIAEYDGEALKSVTVADITFAKDEKRTFMLGNGNYKVFVWNSLSGMVPMTR